MADSSQLSTAVAGLRVTDLDPKQVIRYKRAQVTDSKTGKATAGLLPENTEAGYLPLVRGGARADAAKETGRRARGGG